MNRYVECSGIYKSNLFIDISQGMNVCCRLPTELFIWSYPMKYYLNFSCAAALCLSFLCPYMAHANEMKILPFHQESLSDSLTEDISLCCGNNKGHKKKLPRANRK